MAKGARASTKKANNSKLKSNVFGPVETARTARLSAKLLELASQPKPKPDKHDVDMGVQEGSADEINEVPITDAKHSGDMELDTEEANTVSRSKSSSSGRIEKKRSSSRKASIIFPRYKKGSGVSKSKGGKR